VPRRRAVASSVVANAWSFDKNQQFKQKLELLLKTAASCFNQKGFSGTSLRGVAARLNITDAALYYYVKSKEELVFLCYQRALDLGEQAMRRASEQGTTGLEKLQLYIRYQMEAMCGSSGPVAILSEIPSLKLAHRTHILERTRHDTKTVAAFIQSGIQDGSIRPCNPHLTCAAIFGALNWVPKWYRADGRYDASESAETFMRVLTQGIAASGAGMATNAPIHSSQFSMR
jgi:TetR/AcrR family transcriptional regulator, cholesterol catabolism regulator